MKICGYFFLGGGGGNKYDKLNGNIFWAANFQIFLGIPDIPDFFFFLIFFFLGGGGWGSTVNAGSKPMYEEKLRVPPGGVFGYRLIHLL